RPALPTPYQPPRSDAETRLVQIWEGLLGISPVGIHDDFFELGGHSLLGTRLLRQVEETSGLRLSLGQLFRMPTVAALAAELERSVGARRTPEPVEEDSVRPLRGGLGEGGLDIDLEELSDDAVGRLLASLAPEEVEV
ncbi:MAG: hypothetical protein KDD47_10420, partial [Acidobacteria bacterium]|nr:hypothetical protein [Acidobacteriota bacterium]